ncbi:hypothetical protein SISNIDRAFT_488139 [Sistotremastrum niveocremeum HHB9708]|uniref:Uncharacterized protein n=1 Tax=Sistotremastrum niveocremeum HHB9708 TaxID=1314777 RepID=A0A164RHH0_9AGAM|nr:hypothetical protein SISNIDRAFT_488139 [Sistotremastrum niveocremeum HHB9708]
MSTQQLNRPVALHHSALSAQEFSAFIPDIFDVFDCELPSTQHYLCVLEVDLIHKSLNTLEMRGWLKGRHRGALRITDLDMILEMVENLVHPGDGLRVNHIFAVFRLIAHCLDPMPKLMDKEFVWIPSHPTPSLWPPHIVASGFPLDDPAAHIPCAIETPRAPPPKAEQQIQVIRRLTRGNPYPEPR